MPSFALSSLLLLLAAVTLNTSPLISCLAGCENYSAPDAAFGIVASLVKALPISSDASTLALDDVQAIAALRAQQQLLMDLLQPRFVRPLRVDLQADYVTREISIPGSPGNSNRTLQAFVVHSSLPAGARPRPLVVQFHGGGMVFGKPLDVFPYFFASAVDAVVVAPRYGLAPEHPYPEGPEDCYAALVWAAHNARALGADPECVLVAGISAGALMSSVVAQLAKARGGPKIRLQVLLSPMLTPALMRSKVDIFEEHGALPTRLISWMWLVYTQGQVLRCASDPRCSPLAYTSTRQGVGALTSLPETLLTIGSADVMRSEAEQYAQDLAAAGVKVHVLKQRGSHFSIAFGHAQAELVRKLQQLLGLSAV
jgi:acetyl esterase/lipase